MAEALHIPVASPADVERARREARAVATGAGLGRTEAESVVLAVSELAMNLLRYAEQGAIVLRALADADRGGVEVESVDAGPGIHDVAAALRDGYTTGGGLGSGLPGVRRLMDEFSIESAPTGTRIVARKWTRTASSSR